MIANNINNLIDGVRSNFNWNKETKPKPTAREAKLFNNAAHADSGLKATWMQSGDKNLAVVQFQKILKDQGMYHGPIDGKFGPLTKAGTKLFQTVRNIRVDGIVGPETLTAATGDTYLNISDKVAKGFKHLANLSLTSRAKFGLNDVQPVGGIAQGIGNIGESMKNGVASLIHPVPGARVRSHFGMRKHPILGIIRPHNGTDFAAPQGTPIKAVAAGVVSKVVYSNKGYGNSVEVTHPDGSKSFYAHNAKNSVVKGQKVVQGQTIGLVGSTGLSTGPHLHFELTLPNGKRVDPLHHLA